MSPLCKTAQGLLAGLVLLAAGCHRHEPSPAAKTPLAAAPVKVQTVQSLRRAATEEVVGTVRPRLSALLSTKLSGTIGQMLAVPGQAVKAGQLLVEIDSREIQARLEQATATRDQTQKDLQRFKTLLAQNALTQQEFDAAQSRARVAEAAVKEAETMLTYTRVVAPFDGVVTAKRAEAGDLSTPGLTLVEVEDPRTLRLEADVPEGLVGSLQPQQKLTVRVPAAQAIMEGLVGEIAPAADPLSRTVRVKLDLPETRGVRSGQFGRVAVPVAEVNAIRVPAGAVVVRGQMELAFVVDHERAQMRLVKTGKHLGQEVEVVSGLNSGEQIVVEGAGQLSDGQPVEVRK